MNDRYLVRGKTRLIVGTYNSGKKDGEWVKGYLYCDTGRWMIKQFEFDRADYIDYEVDPSTICQRTGLKDKNGNPIFENDIVIFQFDNDDCPFLNKDTKKRVGKVFFSDFRASWSIAMGRNGSKEINNDLFRYVQNGNRVEVIGSAIDNPELLE